MRLLQSIIQSLFVRTVHFLTIGMAILLFGMVPVGASAATSQLACTPTNLGFGAVVVRQTETLLVTLTNNGQWSATVSGIAVGKSEFTTSNLSLPLVLLAGQSVDLSVSFTPTAMGWTGGTIKFSSNASNAALRLNVAGTGVSSEPVTASPSTVSFGQVAIGTISTVPVVLTNARSWKVTLSSLQTTGGAFSMSGPSFPLTLGAGQSVTVNVAFSPQSAGTTGGELFVSGPRLAIPLTGTGTAPGQLTSNLGSLNFANVPMGSSQTQSVTLANSGGSGLTVSHAILTGTGFTLSGLALPLTLGAGQSATFSVVFAPQSAGSASGNLAFASNASNPAMNLPLSGNTALVAISVNPNNATLVVGSTQQFIANVTGTSKTAVAWTVSGAGCIGVACGTISIDGLYVPPSSVPSPATVTVKATSVVDPTKSASANVAIVGAVAVLLSITPTSASVPTAGEQLFTASVTGTSNPAVTWGLSGAGCSGSSCGALSTSLLSAVYLAPSVAPTPASVKVIATSVVDPTKSASANLIIVRAVVVAPSIGINVSEAEYSWGSFAGASDLAYLKRNNINLIRLPIAWEKAQPVLLGPLDPTYLSAMTTFISAARTQGMQVIVDVHDYGRYNVNWAKDLAANRVATPGTGSDEEIIGSVAVPISAFADFWTKLAGALKGTPGLGYYDIMNEPYNMGGTNVWPSAAQAAVDAIRSVDSKTAILVEGTQWASAYWWPSDNGSLNIIDPANNLLYEAHLYFDADGSGTYSQSYAQQGAYPNIGVDRLQPFLTWLTQNRAKGFLGEVGIPDNDPQWLPVLDKFLTALQAAGISGTYWNYAFHSPSDPSWWPVNDPMSIRLDNGQANPQMDILSKHNAASPK